MAKKKRENKPSIKVTLRQFKQRISHEILKQPENIKTMKTKIIIISIVASFLLNILSFTLKLSETAIKNGNIIFGIVMLMMYFGQRIFESSYSAYADLQNDLFKQIYSSETTQIIMDLCDKTRNKVYKEKDGVEQNMDHTDILNKTKWYLDAVWNFWWHIPTMFAKIATLCVTVTGMILIELSDKAGRDTLKIMILLALCVLIYGFLGFKRIKYKKDFRKSRKENESKEDVLFTEIKNIEFISTNDFVYHANRFRKQLVESVKVMQDERLKLNNVFIKRSVIASGFMILILVIKIRSASTIDLATILDVVAVSSVYSTILNQISNIIGNFEVVADTVIDINTLSEDFENIHSVYLEECSKKFSTSEVESIACNNFTATQDPKKMYQLKNHSPFILKKGDFVLVEGPTGCGKSTLLMLITGKLKLKNNPIIFSNGESGYLQSIAYQTDKSVANNFVINELILDDNTNLVDTSKILKILHGLTLYPELLRMAISDSDINQNLSDDGKVIRFLEIRKVRQFSSGQQQRIALAKLLYSMTDEHQVISLDEAFNRLDDKTAKSCIKFISEYTQQIPRIVLIATHQINLVKPICNKQISFVTDMNNSHIQVTEI